MPPRSTLFSHSVMYTFVLLALVGSALAAPQGFFPPPHHQGGFSSFAPPPTGFPQAPVASRFATPIHSGVPTSRVINFDTSAPVNSFQSTHPVITVVERTEYLNDNGEYSTSAKGSDGQKFTETGKLEPTNDGLDNAITKTGSYEYVSPEGIPVSVQYTADRYGFHPISSAIPQPVVAIQPTF